ncbi:MAG TPA: hypothetical protein VGO91_14845 [Pyrinomonadaceae bacterium]|nr:hypothetical protein [Pyrinomonadaceae bacterium]
MTKRIALLTMMLFAACGLSARPALAQGQSVGTQTTTAPATMQGTQGTQATRAQEQSAEVAPETADVAITAHVTARELRFETVPNPQVEFKGGPQLKTQWDAVRENLPRPVQPGVTYRDIGIRLKIVSVFADIDRIVAEALGEVPIQDELPAQKNPPENNSPQSHAPAIDAPLNNSGQHVAPAQAQPQPGPAPVPGPINSQTGARPQ